MKKVLFVLFVLLAVVGGGGGVSAQVWTTNAPANYQLNLAKNQYGPGYQGIVNQNWLFNGQKVEAGHKYELEVTFRVSAQLTQLQIMLADGTEKANWWTELSEDKPEFQETFPVNTDITKKIVFNCNKGATGTVAQANQIVFDSQGTTRAVNITFSKFTLKRIQ